MAEIIGKEITDEKVWEDFLQKHPESNFLQSWLWGEFYKSLGNKIIRIGFYEKSKLLGLMLAIVENSKRGKYIIVPGGPIINFGNKELIKQFRDQLRNLCLENKCSFARVRPQLIENQNSGTLFRSLGFKPAPMYLHAELTSQLDINLTESELLSNMRKATRYEIRKAENLGIKLAKNDQKNIEKFYELQLETAKRQKFVPFSEKFLKKQFDIFIKNNKAILYTAEYKNKILAQAFIIFYGKEAVYHYGASTDEGRKYPGAYIIQWEAIKEAKRRGMDRYNFWGVAPFESRDHRFAGLSIFKRGFGGADIRYLEAQDLIIDKKRYLIDYLIEKIRRKIRRS